MTESQSPMLSDIVGISRHYQRSIRIDMDLGRADALEGYICHGTALAALDTMSKQLRDSNQRAFTWTGPFGGGKSSLACALACAIGQDKKLRAKARSLLPLDSLPAFDKALPTKRGWLTVPVVGKRTSVVQEIRKALRKAQGIASDSRKASASSIIAEVCSAAEENNLDGTLLLIDEMGKFLEASALGVGDDVYFFQELAEAAARADGNVVVVGILHQSFGQYAARLGIDTREDWSKIQGRYSDIPLVAASDEVVELIGRALEAQERPHWSAGASEAIATSIKARRPAVGKGFAKALDACWPLHPAMAALLGPISKRQFGQNERSTFGFLSSVEPHGFRSYLQSTPKLDATWYRPDDYWDYLRSNLEPAILSSPDGHRWAQAVEAVERAEAKASNPLDVAIIKCIAVIDLFRNGSGLAAETDVLRAIFIGKTSVEIDETLERLTNWRVVLFKKHTGAWSVFEGSDFDIDAAVGLARSTLPGLDFKLLSSLSDLYPVIAKRHYHETGTFRWMDVALCRLEDAKAAADCFVPHKAEFGLFLLALPGKAQSLKSALTKAGTHSRMKPWPVVIGVPPNHARIEDLGVELLALQSVQSRHELGGDPVARREVQARISAVRASLEEELAAALAKASWIAENVKMPSGARLSQLASSLADTVYVDAPGIWSELVNRDSLSSNSVKARRDLLWRMLDSEAQESLGIAGYPAERGLYETLLRSSGLHRQDADGAWHFHAPDASYSQSFTKIWQATRDLFSDSELRVSVGEIHKLWAAPPFGVRAGVMPVILTAFLLAHKGNVAAYKDGVFVPRMTDADIDEYLQDESRFSLRWVTIDEEKTKILSGISKVLSEVGAASAAKDPLEAARGLVALVLELPEWVKRTGCLSPEARSVRDTLIKANDPHKVLFVDLAAVFGGASGDEYVTALRSPVRELASAYDALLKRIESSMLEALDAPSEGFDRLQARAEAVSGVTGDLRQDAFSARLVKHDGGKESVEGILSLAANKPPRDWNDRDIDSALLEIARFALRFRQSEALVSVRGRKPTSEAFAVVIGAGRQTQTVSREFDIPDRHRAKVDSLADELVEKLASQGLKTDVLMAVLAKAGLRLAQDESQEKSIG
jgi:hypothetical protein